MNLESSRKCSAAHLPMTSGENNHPAPRRVQVALSLYQVLMWGHIITVD